MPPTLTLDDFIDKLLDAKFPGISIPAEHRTQMKAELTKALNRFISVKMLEQLSSEEFAEYQKKADIGATDDQLQQYIAQHVGPKIKQKEVFFAQLLGEFRDAYLG